MNKPKIVFLGSGPVAAKSLELLSNNFDVEAVITKPKPTHHRGEFPVLTIIEKHGFKKLEVSNKSELDSVFDSHKFESKLGIIIDFGIIVSKKVIDYFPHGIVNSHFSLLPEWRGADPITFSILSGQPKTGVSLMTIDEGMDTGKLITRKSINILPSETTTSLTERLIELSDQLLHDYIPSYLNGDIKPKNQPHPDRATYSRKLTKEDGVLNWDKPAEQLEREIRAFNEWPKSRTELLGRDVIVTSATVEQNDLDFEPGNIIIIEKKKLLVQTSSGQLSIDQLKPAGKKEMSIQAFLAGYAK
jgi:methionyl-tRNA formyltransferase